MKRFRANVISTIQFNLTLAISRILGGKYIRLDILFILLITMKDMIRWTGAKVLLHSFRQLFILFIPKIMIFSACL